jgi:hypothetical protein
MSVVCQLGVSPELDGKVADTKQLMDSSSGLSSSVQRARARHLQSYRDGYVKYVRRRPVALSECFVFVHIQAGPSCISRTHACKSVPTLYWQLS